MILWLCERMSLDGQVPAPRSLLPGPHSLNGQGGGKWPQGRWELSSGQDGDGDASLHRDVGHVAWGTVDNSERVRQAAGAGTGCSITQQVFGVQECMDSATYTNNGHRSCAMSLPQAPVSLLLLHHG